MKIRGGTVSTPIKPERNLVKANNLTEEEKAIARKNIGAAAIGEGGDTSINDNATVEDMTWSSAKIASEIAAMASYEPIKFESLTVDPAAIELGSSGKMNITFSWKLNKKPTSMLVGRTSIDNTEQSGSYTMSISPTMSTQFTLTAWDGITTASKSVAVNFMNGVYYGVSSVESIDRELILSLTKTLRGSKLPSITVTADEGQYIYYCLPARYGSCTFTVGGFTGGFSLVDTISFTNESGFTEDYYVYRSDNTGLGTTTVTVS